MKLLSAAAVVVSAMSMGTTTLVMSKKVLKRVSLTKLGGELQQSSHEFPAPDSCSMVHSVQMALIRCMKDAENYQKAGKQRRWQQQFSMQIAQKTNHRPPGCCCWLALIVVAMVAKSHLEIKQHTLEQRWRMHTGFGILKALPFFEGQLNCTAIPFLTTAVVPFHFQREFQKAVVISLMGW